MTTQTLSERLADKRSKLSIPTVRRRDISIYEDRELSLTGFTIIQWTAALGGHLSTGEEVSMSRSGSSAAGALEVLEAAIAEQGWGIR